MNDQLSSDVADEIRARTTQWVVALDASDWATVGALLAEDFTYLYRDDDTEFTWFTGRDTAVERLQAVAESVRAVQHYLSNSTVTGNGTNATHTVFDMAFIAPADIRDGDPLRIVGGIWTFDFIRSLSGWLIQHLHSQTVVISPWSDDLSSYPPRGARANTDNS